MIAAGAVLFAPYLLFAGQAFGDVYWDVCIGLILAVAAIAAWRLPNNRGAWLLIVVGQMCFLVGDISWTLIAHVWYTEAYPNVGDIFYVGGYVPIALGLTMLWSAQRERRDLGGVIDGLIVAVGSGVLLWVFLIGPAVFDTSVGIPERVINTAYTAGDLLLIAMGAQLAVRLRKSAPTWMLAGALLALLGADLWYAYLASYGEYLPGHPVDALWWMSYVLVGGLVVNARVGEISTPIAEISWPRLTATRIAVLSIVTVAAPLTIAARAVWGASLELPALLGGSIVLFALVVVRLVLVAMQLESSRGALVHEATHDALTGLGNRTLYGSRVREALLATPTTGARTAVLCIDLDDFKMVNDSLGHAAGDRLLQVVGERLRAVVRRDDSVARLGGDEFAILLESESTDAAIEIANRALAEIRRPLVLDQDLTVYPGASIGIAFGDSNDSVEDLLRDADTAMYLAKSNGKARWEIFQQGMRQTVMERLEMRGELTHALERNELTLHYQPIIEVSTGRISGFEALVRWEHPTRGRIEPGRFIGLAEETGLIVPMGRWILNEACAQVQRLDPSDDGKTIAVNVSVVQLRSSDLVDDVQTVLRSTGLAPHRLLVELTESVMIHDFEEAAETLTRLRALGVRIALDDFGTGYTSLRQLRSLPVDVVKLDQSFITTTMEHDVNLLNSLITMANSLGLQTVGEGIEGREQLALLESLSCGYAQGHLFSRPVPIEQIAELLRESEIALRQAVVSA